MEAPSEIAFFTDDVASMVEFYTCLLGKEPTAQTDGMAIFAMGATKIFIHKTYRPQEGELPPENHIAFAVKDIDLTCKELVAAGLQLEREPADYYWGRSAYLRAPDGQLLELTGTDN